MPKLYPKEGKTGMGVHSFMYVMTGEFRPPKKGEHYISGAIPEAYEAPNTLTTNYAIARRVRVRLVPQHYEIEP